MKRALITIVSVYIAVISAMLAVSAYRGAFRQLFADPVSWRMHTAVSVVLAALGAMIVVCLFVKPSVVPMFQMLWWLPQLIKVEKWHFSPDKSHAVFHSLYHWPMGMTFAVQLGWERPLGDYLFVKLNVVALAGVILAAWLWTQQRARPVTTEDDACGPRETIVSEES